MVKLLLDLVGHDEDKRLFVMLRLLRFLCKLEGINPRPRSLFMFSHHSLGPCQRVLFPFSIEKLLLTLVLWVR